jgi:hypothetical protein
MMLNYIGKCQGKIKDIEDRRLPQARRGLAKAQARRDTRGIYIWKREIAWLEDLTRELEQRITSITEFGAKFLIA